MMYDANALRMMADALDKLKVEHKYVINYRGYSIVLDEGQTIKSNFENGTFTEYFETPNGTPIILNSITLEHWEELDA